MSISKTECPKCGGVLERSLIDQRFHCDSCGLSMSLAERMELPDAYGELVKYGESIAIDHQELLKIISTVLGQVGQSVRLAWVEEQSRKMDDMLRHLEAKTGLDLRSRPPVAAAILGNLYNGWKPGDDDGDREPEPEPEPSRKLERV